MDTTNATLAATELSRARLAGRQLDELAPPLRPADETEAYAVQAVLHEQLTAAGHGGLAGWKIGCTTAVMQRFLGIPNPCAGGVFAPTVFGSGARIAHGDYHHVGVECELAVRLGSDLGGPVDSLEAAAAAADGVMAAIEIVDDRFRDSSAVSAPTLIADDFFGAGCVLGEARALTSLPTLDTIGGAMRIDGEEVGRGTGADILGHPLHALTWLAGCLSRSGRRLRYGDIVLLGSLVQTVWVQRGYEVAVALDGLGEVSVRFE